MTEERLAALERRVAALEEGQDALQTQLARFGYAVMLMVSPDAAAAIRDEMVAKYGEDAIAPLTTGAAR